MSTPGDRLRRERERLGMSLKEVAGAANLPVATLRAIENGEIRSLPGTHDVRFYHRIYAEIVGLPLVALMSDHFPPDDS